MTEKEIEQKAEKYFEDNSEEREYGEGYVVECLVGVKQAYKDGYYQCLEDFGNISYVSVKKLQKEIAELKNKNKWHDLEKDPNDLPDTDRKVLVKCIRFGEKDSYVDGCYCNGGWCHDGSDVSAWKEID